MTIEQAHLDFKLKYDKLDNKYMSKLDDAEIDWLLNDAKLKFISTRFNNNNIAKAGFEDNNSRLNELSTIHIQYPKEPEILVTSVDYGSYKLAKVNLSSLTNEYLYLTSLLVYNEDCKKWVSPIYQDHKTYLEEIANPFNSESIIFNINGEDGSPYIYIYGNVSKVRISYLKYPSPVYKGTYTNPYIQGTTPIQFSLPKATHRNIVNIAVRSAAKITKLEDSSNELEEAYT